MVAGAFAVLRGKGHRLEEAADIRIDPHTGRFANLGVRVGALCMALKPKRFLYAPAAGAGDKRDQRSDLPGEIRAGPGPGRASRPTPDDHGGCRRSRRPPGRSPPPSPGRSTGVHQVCMQPAQRHAPCHPGASHEAVGMSSAWSRTCACSPTRCRRRWPARHRPGSRRRPPSAGPRRPR